MNITIIILILIGLIIHRYLSAFWEQKILPYPKGFTFISSLFALLYTINFIRMFGFWIGLLISALCFFQLVYSTFLWPFLLPSLKNILSNNTITKVNLFVYSICWNSGVILILILTIINLFIAEYKEFLELLKSFIDTKNITIISILIISSNIIRGIVMKKIMKF